MRDIQIICIVTYICRYIYVKREEIGDKRKDRRGIFRERLGFLSLFGRKGECKGEVVCLYMPTEKPLFVVEDWVGFFEGIFGKPTY